MPFSVRNRPRIASKRLSLCQHTQTRGLGRPKTAVLRDEFRGRGARPFSLDFLPRPSSAGCVVVGSSQTRVPGSSRNHSLVSKTRAANFCCPQSFKERAPNRMCATGTWWNQISGELHPPQGAARFGPSRHKATGVVCSACACDGSEPLTPRHSPSSESCFRLALRAKESSRLIPSAPVWTGPDFHSPRCLPSKGTRVLRAFADLAV